MPESESTAKKLTKQATEKLFAALNRADEIGGEIRDYMQDKMATDPRYVAARKRLAKLLGKSYESRSEVQAKATAKAEQRAAVAAVTPTTKAPTARPSKAPWKRRRPAARCPSCSTPRSPWTPVWRVEGAGSGR